MSGSPVRLYRYFRGQLGSIRTVYARGNQIVRRGDLGQRQQTVLLLHGFMQTRAIWEVMEDRLRYDGYGVFSFDLGGLLYRFNTRRVDDLAEYVAEKIEGICERYGMDGFHIIGHSKGGLVARRYVQHFGGDARVRSLITLGTPHHGTPTAAIGVGLFAGGLLGRSPWDMMPGSGLVKWLNRDTFPAHIPMTSIYSKADLVCPHWFSVLRPKQGETSIKNIGLGGIGHSGLCYDPAVYVEIKRELDHASMLWRERQGVEPEK